MTLTFLFLSLFTLSWGADVRTASVGGSRSWINVDVRSFDGQGITAGITLSVSGNHENAFVRIWGENSTADGQSGPCFATICIKSSVGVAVGRIIREVVFSADENITTFHYVARFLEPHYQTNTILGIPPFPFDEHRLNVTITTDFNADIDGHRRTPILSTANYEGRYQVTAQGMQDGQYIYKLFLVVFHPSQFVLLMSFLTWGTIIFTAMLTAFLLRLSRNPSAIDNVVTASSGIIVFLPVFELSLQSFKSPLAITLSDIPLLALFVTNVFVVILAIWKKFR